MILAIEKDRNVIYYTDNMDWGEIHGTKAVAERLRQVQAALTAIDENNTQAEVARTAKISKSAWNNALTGDNRLGVNDAIKLWQAYQIDLKWTYLGIPTGLPHDIKKKIDELKAAGLL